MALNPAHAGIKTCIDIHSLYRIQWVGFQGAPKSGFLTLSAPIKTKRKNYLSARQGLGLKFETDQKTFHVSERQILLKILIDYYSSHLDGFKRPKSLDVLKEVFS